MPNSAVINLGDVQDGVLQNLEARLATDEDGNFIVEDSTETVKLKFDETNDWLELLAGQNFNPVSEPDTPTDGAVTWYDETSDALQAKFSDGSTVTLAEV